MEYLWIIALIKLTNSADILERLEIFTISKIDIKRSKAKVSQFKNILNLIILGFSVLVLDK
jgi:hypothetical protein